MSIDPRQNSKNLAENICQEFGLEVEFGDNMEGTEMNNAGWIGCNCSAEEWLRYVVNRINYTG